METFYEKTTDEGKEYWSADGVVYQDFKIKEGAHKGKPKDLTYARFEKMLEENKVKVVSYAGSDLEAADKAKEDERKAGEEKRWAQGEIEKLKSELLEELLANDNSKKQFFEALKAHKKNPSANRPTRG